MWRTPSSLKWLIKKRSRLSGTLLHLESQRAKYLARLVAINAKLPIVQRDLAAIDMVLPQHEIQVEPTDIAPVVPHEHRSLLPYGQMTKVVLQILREQNGWLTARELTARVGVHVKDFEYIDPRLTLEAVRRRLNQLAKKGIVERQSATSAEGRVTGGHGRWRLVRRKPTQQAIAAPEKLCGNRLR